jgi:hypothetical protein
LQSKKGFIITGIVLAAITAGSFAIWLMPQNIQTKFIISNSKEDLDALIEQQGTISDSTAEEFDKMLSGQITPDNYISVAEISSSQINSFIIKIIQSEVPPEWQASYSSFTDFLRTYNSYLKETIVIANKIKENPQSDISQEKAKIDELLKQAEEFLAISNSARPT